MKLRRLYTLCLLAVYLLSVGGVAFATLTCPCLTRHTHEQRHVCDARCMERNDYRAHSTAFSENCCGSHKNGDAGLYIFPDSNYEKQARRALRAADMPSALPVYAMQFPQPDPILLGRICQPRLIFRSDPPVLHAGLRAPPVVA